MKKNVRDYKVNGKQYAYILDAIVPENVDKDSDGMSDKDKVVVLLEEFNQCANYPYNKKVFRNIVDRFANWAQGLPSVFNIAFEDENIIKTGKSWGYCKTAKKSELFVDNWFRSIASKTFQLAEKLGVDTYKYR